jgi:hypothetical protein
MATQREQDRADRRLLIALAQGNAATLDRQGDQLAQLEDAVHTLGETMSENMTNLQAAVQANSAKVDAAVVTFTQAKEEQARNVALIAELRTALEQAQAEGRAVDQATMDLLTQVEESNTDLDSVLAQAPTSGGETGGETGGSTGGSEGGTGGETGTGGTTEPGTGAGEGSEGGETGGATDTPISGEPATSEPAADAPVTRSGRRR